MRWAFAALVGLLLVSRRAAALVSPAPAPEPTSDWGDSVELMPLKSAPGHRLASAAARAFDAAAEQSSAPRVTSSFRTREQQERLYALYLAGKGNLAARPGTSLHESGLAVDARGTPEWEAAMLRNGFKRTVSSEPWHWEFRR